MPADRGQGFTLLEAIVAIALVSSVLMALYSLINTDLISLRRAEAAVQSQTVIEEFTHRIELVQLGDGADGEIEIPPYTVDWRASLVEPTQMGRQQRGAPGLYDLSLFDVSFEVRRDSAFVTDGTLRQLRYVMVRALENEFGG